MSVTTVHTLYGVKVESTYIDQITNFTVSPNVNEWILAADGQVDPTFVAVGEARPVIGFTTTACKTALGTAGIAGKSFVIANGGLLAYFQKVAEGSTRSAPGSSNHIKLTADDGILLPRRMSATQGQVAEIEYEAVISSSDDNTPIATAASQALDPAVAPTVGEAYTVGAVSLNGNTVNGVQSITVDFGLTEYVLAGDGSAWPTFVAINERRPSITVTTHDLDLITTGLATGLDGVAQETTDSTIAFAEVTEGSAVRGGASIIFTIDEGRIRYSAIGGRHGEPQVGTLTITPTFDGTAAIMAISGV